MSQRPVTVSVGGLALHVPRDMAWAYRPAPVYYEHNVVHWIQRVVARLDRPIVFDVGANIGFYTVLLAPQVDRVFTFEPVGETFTALRRNIEQNHLANVVPFQLGLAALPGAAAIKVYSASGNSSLDVKLPAEHMTTFVREETISLTTIDQLVADHAVVAPSIIKLDVEGGEVDVIRGARTTLSQARPVVFAEHNRYAWFHSGARDALLEELANQDYVVRGLTEDGKDFTLYEIDQFEHARVGNVVAVPREQAWLLR